jgi:hypothetical protein
VKLQCSRPDLSQVRCFVSSISLSTRMLRYYHRITLHRVLLNLDLLIIHHNYFIWPYRTSADGATSSIKEQNLTQHKAVKESSLVHASGLRRKSYSQMLLHMNVTMENFCSWIDLWWTAVHECHYCKFSCSWKQPQRQFVHVFMIVGAES